MKTAELLEIARETVVNAYCPYSDFHVSAVLVGENEFYTGLNVENVSFGLTMCAERVAMFKAVSDGKRKFLEMLIYSPDGMPYPCGACRQVMAEFCSKDFKIMVTNGQKFEQFTLGELLPFTFKL